MTGRRDSAVCSSCSRPIGFIARVRGATLCSSCAESAVRSGQDAVEAIRPLHPEHAWGHHYEVPEINDRDMRRLVQRVAAALPRAASAADGTTQRAVISSVWPELMECAAHMNGTPTPDCLEYVSAADGMATARMLLSERDEETLFLAFWRLWWTAASHIGHPVQAAEIADAVLPAEDATVALDQLCDLAYAYYYDGAQLGGTGLPSGYAPFIDCEGCQEWRAGLRETNT